MDKMTYAEWRDKFKPRGNQFVEPTEGDFNNTLYAPYGAQHDWVLKTDTEYIWTLTADGKQIIPGFRCDDRKGCFITNVPWNTMHDIQVIVELEEEQDMIKMTYDEWFAKFSPIRNPWKGINDHRFDAAGHQWDYVKARADGWKVWTVVDEEGLHIIPGYHTVNQMGFYITEVPWNSVKDGARIVVEPFFNPYEQIQNLTQEQEILVGGCHTECPSCTHEDLEAAEWDTDGDTVYRRVSCNRCNAVWQEVFKFYLNEDMDGKPLLSRSQLWDAQ